ncbi:hypothetical protein [Halalkalibacter hemicellulosilyticus]|uniref:Uncharacterized protein n=1 Tax=Halalkalibacter hemicellulosilyticusJCM 9152 TaxID=1236971 RepID=W4QHR4_9BACI|nr:hypothetical protein [Halalkalibacter hemicellulosilyticus]GAE31198.1 hypothetical protein JCM9152_2651 [Halalkalibacter hemicellulosilyticusJCM 9152]
MTKLEEPFNTFWTGKDIDIGKPKKKNASTQKNHPFYTLKKAIQDEVKKTNLDR